ncbi:outer membrane lipoprotein-sorting protein [Saccharophagus degradans]|uniref:outer membrane lipoprotein-sorting protein n=1 Tax=Saccharophagus degradans TaxID=86304 RepID=UPI002477D275|nr:outer membrane lipoprotein-sorting protein [Saccharophagus degradans]WGO96545.1 outer membrane lipoprotein-sorting protein [Saccharophagus degradans]
MRNIICSLVMLCSVNALCEESKAPLTLASADAVPVEQNVQAGTTENEAIAKLFKTMESNMFPSSAFAEMTLTSYKDDKKLKELKMEFVSKQDSVLIEIKAPAVDRGKYILKSSDNLWMYFSEIKRSIRIASRDSFMGTDANNYDLLELDLVGDYELTSHNIEIVEGIKLIRAELTAKPDTEGYASIVSYLDPEKKIIVKNDCYALSGVLLKSIHYFDHKQVGDYFVPSKITFVSQLEAGRHSVVSLNGVKPQHDLADSLFSLGYLESLN